MPRIYEFSSYREYLKNWLATRPAAGKGQKLKLAEAVRVHPSLISQILSGTKDLTLEQAYRVGEYCGLRSLEREYFYDLVQWERAGDSDYRRWLSARLAKTRAGLRKDLGDKDSVLHSEYEKAVFYSAWYYSAIHLATALPGHWNCGKIAERLSLPPPLVEEALSFLVATGLCAFKEGRYCIDLRRTHIELPSIHLDRFLTNWRMRGIEKIPSSQAPQFFHSQQLYLSEDDAVQIRDVLARLARKIGKKMEGRGPERVYCLNIDWFET